MSATSSVFSSSTSFVSATPPQLQPTRRQCFWTPPLTRSNRWRIRLLPSVQALRPASGRPRRCYSIYREGGWQSQAPACRGVDGDSNATPASPDQSREEEGQGGRKGGGRHRPPRYRGPSVAAMVPLTTSHTYSCMYVASVPASVIFRHPHAHTQRSKPTATSYNHTVTEHVPPSLCAWNSVRHHAATSRHQRCHAYVPATHRLYAYLYHGATLDRGVLCA